MLQRYLLLWLVLLSTAAFCWPRWLPAFDPFVITGPYLAQLFAVTMFAIGCLLPRDEIVQVLSRWPSVCGGTLVQYLSMPLIAYATARAFGLEGDRLLGVIFVGCVPGAMASNVLTLTARGNVSYSVSPTTLATLVSPVFVPVALYVTLRQTTADPAALAKSAFTQLLLLVVLPVLSGHLLARRLSPLEQFMRRWGPVIANLAILWIIAVVVNKNHKRLEQMGTLLPVVLIAINLLGYAAGWGGSRLLRLADDKRRALTLEVGMQNAGLGATLASQLFEGRSLVALPPALYTFGCMLTGTLLAQLWARRASAE